MFVLLFDHSVVCVLVPMPPPVCADRSRRRRLCAPRPPVEGETAWRRLGARPGLRTGVCRAVAAAHHVRTHQRLKPLPQSQSHCAAQLPATANRNIIIIDRAHTLLLHAPNNTGGAIGITTTTLYCVGVRWRRWISGVSKRNCVIKTSNTPVCWYRHEISTSAPVFRVFIFENTKKHLELNNF